MILSFDRGNSFSTLGTFCHTIVPLCAAVKDAKLVAYLNAWIVLIEFVTNLPTQAKPLISMGVVQE